MKETTQHPADESPKTELITELARATPDLVVVNTKNPKLKILAAELGQLEQDIALHSKAAVPAKIENPEQLRVIEQDLLEDAELLKRAEGFLKPFTSWAHAFHKSFTGYRENLIAPLLDHRAKAEPVRKAYIAEQERKRQAEEDRINAENEAKAKAERERLEKEATKLRTPELREQRLAQAAAVEATRVTVPSRIVPTAGIQDRQRWVCEIQDAKKLAAYLFTLPDWSAYLEMKHSELDKLAGRMKSTGSVPGALFKQVRVMAVGRR